MTDKMREEFEAWAITSAWLGLSTGCMEIHDDDYVGCELQAAWLSWQASRAALVIDVPDENDDRFWSLLDEPTADGNSHIFLEGTFTDAVHDAIESAGVRVKP